MTVFDEHRNLALGTVSAGSGIIDSTSGTTLVAASDAEADEFPAVPFFVTVWRDQTPDRPAVEIVRATAFDGTRTFTVERAQQGTTAQAFIAQGWKFANTITVADITAIEDALNAEEVARTAGDASTLAAAEAYASAHDATTLAAAESYTDGKVATEATARIAGDAATLTSSESYTDAGVSGEAAVRAAADSTLQSHIDAEATARASGDAATLASAETYTDGRVSSEATARVAGDAATLASAEGYADAHDAATLATAEGYTDGRVSVEAAARVSGDAATLASAKTYTDAQVASEAALRVSGDASTLAAAEAYTDAALGARMLAHTIDVFETSVANLNFNLYSFQANYWNNKALASDGTQGAFVTFAPRLFEAGTWALAIDFRKTTASGIYTVEISTDGSTWTSLATIDGYLAANTTVRQEVLGLTIAAGFYYVRLRMATKNPSSTGFFGQFSGLHFVRTGP